MPLQVTHFPPCDMDEQHLATTRCDACDEWFCDACDALVHARKKNKAHARESLELLPVPCDSDPAHVAVMYCEDCEENFCSDCDYAFHSRKKTAGHARFEGARRLEDIELLAAEAAAEKAAQEAAAAAAQRKAGTTSAQAGSHVAAAAATATPVKATPSSVTATPSSAAKLSTAAASASAASPAKPAVAKAAPAAATAATAAPATAVTPAVAPAAAEAAAADGAAAGDVAVTGAERAAPYKPAWDAKRKQLCKQKYNVGHWLGLSTDERKDLSVELCQAVLFDPQPSTEKGRRQSVEWSVQSFWTTYGIHVQCAVVSGSGKKRPPSQTVYRVAVDDMGRLESFEVEVDGVAATGGCAIM